MTRAIQLYRAVVRTVRGMDAEQRVSAMGEARAAFARGATLRGHELAQALELGEKRVQVAKHYGIAYERMTYTELAGGGNKDIEAPIVDGSSRGVSDVLRSTMSAQFPVNPAGAAARARARAKRAAVADAEMRGDVD